jgi:hypothetical protein
MQLQLLLQTQGLQWLLLFAGAAGAALSEHLLGSLAGQPCLALALLLLLLQ